MLCNPSTDPLARDLAVRQRAYQRHLDAIPALARPTTLPLPPEWSPADEATRCFLRGLTRPGTHVVSVTPPTTPARVIPMRQPSPVNTPFAHARACKWCSESALARQLARAFAPAVFAAHACSACATR